MKNFKYIYFIFFLLQTASASLSPTLHEEKDTLTPSTDPLKGHMQNTERFKQEWKGVTVQFSDEPQRTLVNLTNFADQEIQIVSGKALNFLINLRRKMLKKDNLTLPEFPPLPDTDAPLKVDDLLEWLRVRQKYLGAKKVFDSHLMVTLQGNEQIRKLLSWLDLSTIPHGEDAIYQGCSDEVLRRTLRLSTVLGALKESDIQTHQTCFEGSKPCASDKCLWIHLVQNHKMSGRKVKGHTQKMMVRTAHYDGIPTSLMNEDIPVYKEVLDFRRALLERTIKSIEEYIHVINKYYERVGADWYRYETHNLTEQDFIFWEGEKVHLSDLSLSELELLRFKFHWKMSRALLRGNLVSPKKVLDKSNKPRAITTHGLLKNIKVLHQQKNALKQKINDLYQSMSPLNETLESLDCSLSDIKRGDHKKRIRELKVLLEKLDTCALGNLGNQACGSHCLISKLDTFWARENLAEYEGILNRQVCFLNAALAVELDVSKPDETYAKNFLTDELGRFYAAHLKFFKNLGYQVSLEHDFPIFLDTSYSLMRPDGSMSSFRGDVSDVPKTDWHSLSALAHDNRQFLEVMNYAMEGSKELGNKPRPNMTALVPLAPKTLAECTKLLVAFQEKLQGSREQLLNWHFKARNIESRRESFNKSRLRNPYFGRIEGIGFVYLFDIDLLPKYLEKDLVGLTQTLNFMRRYCVVLKYTLQAIGADFEQSGEALHGGELAQKFESVSVVQKLVGDLTLAMTHNSSAFTNPRKVNLLLKESSDILNQIKAIRKLASSGDKKAEVIKKFDDLEKAVENDLKNAASLRNREAVGILNTKLMAVRNARKNVQKEIPDNRENITPPNVDMQNASTSQQSQSASATSSSSSSSDLGNEGASATVTTIGPASPPATHQDPKDAEQPKTNSPAEETATQSAQAPSAPPLEEKKENQDQVASTPDKGTKGGDTQVAGTQGKGVSSDVKAAAPNYAPNYAPFAKKHWQQQKQRYRAPEPKENKRQPTITTAGMRKQAKYSHVPPRRDSDQEWEQEARDGDWQQVPPRFKKNQRGKIRTELGSFPNSVQAQQLNSVEAPKDEIQVPQQINSEVAELNPDLAQLFQESAGRNISWADASDDDDHSKSAQVQEVTVAVNQPAVPSTSSSETEISNFVTTSNTIQVGTTSESSGHPISEISPQDSFFYPHDISIAPQNPGLEVYYPGAYSQDLPTQPDAMKVELIRSRVREGIASQRAHELLSENLLLRQQLDALNQSLLKQEHDLQKSRGEQVKLSVEKQRLEKIHSALLTEFAKNRSSDYFDPEKQRSTLDAPDSRD